MLHGEMSGRRAPLGAAGDRSEQALFLFLSIHIIDIVGYSKQVTLYYTHLAGVVTGEAFLFLASVTTLSLKVCVIHMVIFCYNLQCHYYVYSNKKKWFKHHYYVIIKFFIWGHIQSI